MSNMSRKEFLRTLGFGFATVAGISAINSCGGSDKKSDNTPKMPEPVKKNVGPCEDLSSLEESQKAIRDTFKYVTKSPNPEQVCTNCNFFKEPEAGSECGGCQLFTGPVTNEGYCSQWAQKVEQG